MIPRYTMNATLVKSSCPEKQPTRSKAAEFHVVIFLFHSKHLHDNGDYNHHARHYNSDRDRSAGKQRFRRTPLSKASPPTTGLGM